MKFSNDCFFKKTFLRSFLLIVIGIVFNRCSYDTNKNAGEANQVVIEVGQYRVTFQEFEEQLELLKAKGTPTRGSLQQLIDNYVSAGLLVQLARKNNIDQSADYKKQLIYIKTELVSKFAKIKRLESFKNVAYDQSKFTALFDSTNVIDYIWVPLPRKDVSKEILDRLNSGSSVQELVNSNKFDEWNKLNLRFYINLPTGSAPFTADLLERINNMKIGTFKVFETQSGYHLIKVISRSPNGQLQKSTNTLLLNLKIAQAIENGDTTLNPYVLNKDLKVNDSLLANIPFQIEPLAKETSNGKIDDNPEIAEFLGKIIYKKQIMAQLKVLPLNIQSVFKNKSTRALKIVNLILANNADLYNNKILELNNYRSWLTNFLHTELDNDRSKDTVKALVKIIEANLGYNGGNFVDYRDQMLKTPRSMYAHNDESELQIISFDQRNKYSWVYDDNQPGKEAVKLNFSAIDKLDLPDVLDSFDRDLIAYSRNWRLTAAQLKLELNKLTPESRLAISAHGDLKKLIYYLMERDVKSVQKQPITINKKLIEKIDVVGSSIDSLHDFEKYGILGALGNTKINEATTIRLVANMPKNERNKFRSNFSFRKEAFKQLLIDEFWKDQVDMGQLIKDPDFNRSLQKRENWLLANMYYQSVLLVNVPETDDDFLNMQLKKVSRVISEKRLKNTLDTEARKTPIKINRKLLEKLGISAGKSIYNLMEIKG